MISILLYHQVAEVPSELDPRGLAIPPDQFEQQMSYLAQNSYQCLTLPEAVQYFQNGKPTPDRSFVLTFDDGYQDFYTVACPILEKFGFTATVFLVAGRMGSLSNWEGQEGPCSGMLMSWAEARDLARRGFILASHTLSHPRLTHLDDQPAFEEIRNSRVLLQDRLDMQVDFFSYPYSASDTRIERMIESAGYTAACAGDSGPWSVLNLWRTQCVRGDTTLSFALKVNGWVNRWIALHESAPGRLLHRNMRMLRRRPAIHPPDSPGFFEP
jgi:peptidoglycan/xylan/chitin deacetylase (PgdA/CDA1 family)